MKVVCPNCGKAYYIPEDSFSSPVMKANCKQCGTTLRVHKDTGRVEAEERESVLSMGQNEQGGRDYLAIGVVAAVILAFPVVAFLGLKSVDRDSLSKPFAAVSKLIKQFEEGGKRDRGKVQRRAGKPQTRFQKHLSLAHKHFKAKKYDAALKEYNQAIKADPRRHAAYYWRGQLFVKKGEYNKAVKDLKRTLKLNPSNKSVYSTLGWAYIQMGEYNEAIGYLNEYIAFKPEDGWAYYQRGHCYYKKGDMERALMDAKRSCDLGYKDGCKIYKKFKG